MNAASEGASQSALRAAGPVAQSLLEVSGVLAVGGAVIFAGVMLLLVLAVARPGGDGVSTRRWLLGGGLAFPTVVLSALFAYSEFHRPPWRPIPPPGALIVGVTGHMWWWEVRYRDAASGAEVVTANEIRIPVGRPIYFGLGSADVIHSFWVPSLGGKMDMLPGRVQHLLLQADRPGTWRGQCAEYCGEQHARMALHVVAEEPAAFDAWLAAQARPAAAASREIERGREAFLAHRCNACHTVRGVSEQSRLGPDLTHVGSRLHLGAGTVANDAAQLAAWVAHTQQLKPGARMPSAGDRIGEADLQSIAAWLAQLK
ncbi:cytochrome c oxidase subunit II [Variovorax sp. V59]|uniref:cytochrome c oxidase subunit II n=1 Tax=Variovorax TaxID=34072 RepID=UPI001786C4F6|nr:MULTISPECIES: c-type cytochrome [Variovorax]MBD9663123.1 c-type cytochrome [Variovorax sp. VRV01]MDR6454156.1 cytochrome c oxidase subunit 2 [Variovorax paradoxus]